MSEDRMDSLAYENTRLADYTNDSTIERGHIDIPFLVVALLLLTIGVIMVLSASYASAYYDTEGETSGNATYYFVRQLIFAFAGVAVMAFFSRLPMGMFKRASGIVLLASIGLLGAVMIFGTTAGGAKRWLNLGFTTFQPSELAKIALILYFARMICRFKDRMRTFRYGILPFVLILGVIAILLALEPHFSAVIIIVALGLVMMFVGGVPMFWYILGIAVVIPTAILVYMNVPYIQSRIIAWRNPFLDAADSGWQVVQSLYAIGSGGFLGLGLGNSRQKYLYLPEEHNDYIFSVICEELGFLGAVLIIVLFALLVARGFWIAKHSRDRYSYLVAVGISTLFALQVAMNIAVCTNAMPSTGISLPLFSYGGTALLIQMAEIGIMLSISRDIRRDSIR